MEISTRRFLLRDFVAADRPAFLAYHADPRALAFRDPAATGAEAAERLIDAFRPWAGERPRLNYQLAIVPHRAGGPLVGCCGVRCAGQPPGEAGLGIELAPAFWGRHAYAVEVGRALLDYGFGPLGLTAIHGTTISANDRVARLADWFGAEVVGMSQDAPWLRERGWSEVRWRLPRERWLDGAGR